MKKQSKLSELRWPIGIVLAIFGVIALGVWTIEQANVKPVVMDDFYFDSYQDVELNYNDIVAKQQAFDKKYALNIDAKNFALGKKNRIDLTLTDRASGKGISDANVTLKITRPDTDQFDKRPKVLSSENGHYIFESFMIDKPGRWQILTKIVTPDNLISFTKHEVNATE